MLMVEEASTKRIEKLFTEDSEALHMSRLKICDFCGKNGHLKTHCWNNLERKKLRGRRKDKRSLRKQHPGKDSQINESYISLLARRLKQITNGKETCSKDGSGTQGLRQIYATTRSCLVA